MFRRVNKARNYVWIKPPWWSMSCCRGRLKRWIFKWRGPRGKVTQVKRRNFDEWQRGWQKVRGRLGAYNSEWQARKRKKQAQAAESGWRNKGVTEWRIDWCRGQDGEEWKWKALEVIRQEKKWEYDFICYSKDTRSGVWTWIILNSLKIVNLISDAFITSLMPPLLSFLVVAKQYLHYRWGVKDPIAQRRPWWDCARRYWKLLQ